MKLSTKSSFFALSLALLSLAPACTQEPRGPKAGEQVSAEPDAEAQANAQANADPDAKDLLAAHVEAAGGAEIIEKFETIHALGNISVPGQKLSGTSEIWWQRGGKFFLEQDVEGIGKSRAGYDGETIWLDDPITGLRILEGQERASYLQSSLMFPGHDWAQHFDSAKTLGKVAIEAGEKSEAGEVWEVELESKQGVNTTIGLDVNTKLIRYMKTSQVTPMGTMPIESFSEGYEAVEGYLFAMNKRSSIRALFELREEITKFEANVEIDESLFTFPSKRERIPANPEMQDLAEELAAAQAPAPAPSPAPAQP